MHQICHISNNEHCADSRVSHVELAGQALVQERRLVVRRDAVGSAAAGRGPAVRRADQRAGGGELQPLVPRQRSAAAAVATGRLPPRDLRPAERVLAASRGRQTALLRDPPVPAAQEPRLCASALVGLNRLNSRLKSLFTQLWIVRFDVAVPLENGRLMTGLERGGGIFLKAFRGTLLLGKLKLFQSWLIV